MVVVGGRPSNRHRSNRVSGYVHHLPMTETSKSSPESGHLVSRNVSRTESKGTQSNQESGGSSGGSSRKQARVSLFQQAVRNTVLEDIARNRSFHQQNLAQSFKPNGQR